MHIAAVHCTVYCRYTQNLKAPALQCTDTPDTLRECVYRLYSIPYIHWGHTYSSCTMYKMTKCVLYSRTLSKCRIHNEYHTLALSELGYSTLTWHSLWSFCTYAGSVYAQWCSADTVNWRYTVSNPVKQSTVYRIQNILLYTMRSSAAVHTGAQSTSSRLQPF
jgi:hypothetical protein